MNILTPTFFICLLGASAASAQNLVPNPGFEETTNCAPLPPTTICCDAWRENHFQQNPAMNSPDLCYNTNIFFPPQSIASFEGTKNMAVDCSIENPEYIQARLTTPMVAGTTYCVSFHASIFEFSSLPAVPLGAYFSATRVTVNPYVAGLSAHVQGNVANDPAIWTTVSGTYVATGGEEYITLGGFENTLSNNNANDFLYMYIDLVEVRALAPLDLGEDRRICAGETVVLDAGDDGTAFQWNTGQTTSSITATLPGTYTVERLNGECSVTDVIILTTQGCGSEPQNPVPPGNPDVPENPTPGPIAEEVSSLLYCPNTFTPNGDEANNRFGAKGDHIDAFQMTVYNRWGETVFYADDISDEWDGTHNDRPAAEGMYAYEIVFSYGAKRERITGHVSLLR